MSRKMLDIVIIALLVFTFIMSEGTWLHAVSVVLGVPCVYAIGFFNGMMHEQKKFVLNLLDGMEKAVKKAEEKKNAEKHEANKSN